MNQNWSNQTVENVAQHFSVDLGLGLTDKQVEENTHKFGFNELKEKEKETLLTKIINQLKDLMIIILMAASVVSAIVGEVADAAVIIAIIVINAVLGIVQEGKAEKALEALQKMSAPNAKTLRNGAVTVIPARNVVPGDILLIEAGDIIPADARIFESANLKIEEASLTGESVPSEKDGSAVLAGDVGIGDRVNMVFSSTICTYGRGKALVVGTGSSTEIGKIADKIQEIEAEQTPLQKNLEQLGKWLGIICLAICAVVFVLLSEMYPNNVRGIAMSIAGLALWIGRYLVGQLTPWLLANVPPFAPAGTFFLFALMCVPYLLIMWKLVPETTGKTLEEIERYWKDR